MLKYKLGALAIACLLIPAVAYPLRAHMSRDPEYQRIIAQRPWYFLIGLGDAVAIGRAAHFSAAVSDTASSQTVSPDLSIGRGFEYNLALGYRFVNWPLRIALSRMYILSSMDSVDPAVNFETVDLPQTVYTALMYFDWPMTEHWFVSFGSGLGLIHIKTNNIAGKFALANKNAYGFAYQAITGLQYRFSRFFGGVSYTFVGSTLHLRKFYPTANQSGYLYGGAANIEFGFML